MKRLSALYPLMIATGLCSPAWGQDQFDGKIPAPYISEPSANGFRTRDPYAPNVPTNSHASIVNPYTEVKPYDDPSPSGDETALNPYATGAPKANDRNGADNGRGNANPYAPYFTWNRPGRVPKPYGNRPGAIPSAPGARGTYDQYGNYDDGLTTYPYNPRAVSNPYDPYRENGFANANGGYDSPYRDQTTRNPYGADLPGAYDQYGAYGKGSTSNPYDYDSASNPYNPYSTVNPYAGNEYRYRGAPDARPRSPSVPKLNDHSRDYGFEPASKPDDARANLNSSMNKGDPYADQSATDARAANTPNPQDQTGDHDSGLTPNRDDPGLVSNPSGRRDRPYADQSATAPRPASPANLDDPMRDRDPGSASNPRKPGEPPNPYPGAGAFSGNRSAMNPHGVTAPKSDPQKGVYRGSMSSNPSAAQAAPNPVERGVHPSSPDGLGTPSGSANPNASSLSPKL